MTAVLVTGAGGQLGRELCRRLGTAAIGLSRRRLDVTDPAALRQALESLRPAAVIHAAGYTHVDRAEQQADLARRVNADSTAALADWCRRTGCWLVSVSSDYVFGADVGRQQPYTEHDLPGPVNVYGQTKLAGEQAAAACPRHLVVRTCGLYGSGREDRDFVAKMLTAARRGQPLRVVADQRCSPGYLPHVAAAIVALLRAAQAGRAEAGIYHVTNPGSTTWHGLAEQALRTAGMSNPVEPITSDQWSAAAPRPRYSVLDTGKLQQCLGQGLASWQDALRECIAARSGGNDQLPSFTSERPLP